MNGLDFKSIAPGVWAYANRFPRFSNENGVTLVSEINNSPLRRTRVCMHKNVSDRMQEMFIAFDGTTYVRPSFHKDKDESFHMIDGFAKYVFFDKTGEPISDVRLGPYESDLPFYCRIPANLSHSLIVYSKNALAHEVGEGPFEKSNTIFPDWSFDYTSDEDKANFRKKYSAIPLISQITRGNFERISETVYQAQAGVVSIYKADIQYLKSEVNKTKRNSVRLNVHQSVDAKLHEMFVVYKGSTYIRPIANVDRDKSLYILEGTADFIFFDDKGEILDVIELSDKVGKKNNFVRVPQNLYHTIIMRSEFMVVHEAMIGPFDTKDTDWVSWAPADDDHEGIIEYQDSLERQVQSFKA